MAELALDSDFWSPFLGHVWHLTWPKPAAAILRSRTIEPSSSTRPFSQPQTENSYALQKSYVALFDFRGADEDLVKEESFKWIQYFQGHPFRVGFKIDPTRLDHELISADEAKEEVGYDLIWVPHFEAWSPSPVPLEIISEFWLIFPPRDAKALVVEVNDEFAVDEWCETLDELATVSE